jgi:DNA-binding NarL/FixJ family response regulator
MPVRVMLVDDDEVFRRSCSELLASRGFVIAGEAGSLADARAAIAGIDPDALVLDVNLRDGSGIALATELTQAGARARVLLTSSDARAVSQRLLARCGAAGFVPKPDLATADLRSLLG